MSVELLDNPRILVFGSAGKSMVNLSRVFFAESKWQAHAWSRSC